jgi:hypothetical protein
MRWARVSSPRRYQLLLGSRCLYCSALMPITNVLPSASALEMHSSSALELTEALPSDSQDMGVPVHDAVYVGKCFEEGGRACVRVGECWEEVCVYSLSGEFVVVVILPADLWCSFTKGYGSAIESV